MTRAGMLNLIARLRMLTQAGQSDFTLNGENYFSNDHLQDILDQNVTYLVNEPLVWQPDIISGGTVEYHTCYAGYRDFEEATSGTAYWAVRTSAGDLAGTADYTADYGEGRIVFTTDQAGTAYYLTARSYDLYSAAADVWLARQSFYSTAYNFRSDGQQFDRQALFDHAVVMEKQMRSRAGQNRGRGVLHRAHFVRTDVNPSE